MRSKGIIGFGLVFILIFLLVGLSTVGASNLDDSVNNLSDSLESGPISNSGNDIGSNSIDEDIGLSGLGDSHDDIGVSGLGESIDDGNGISIDDLSSEKYTWNSQMEKKINDL